MPHDVFISHSNLDKGAAELVCAALEGQGVRCWIAPRDIAAGSEWDEALMDAIAHTRAVVLVFSSHANESVYVKREVRRASECGVPILPWRIEPAPLGKALAFHLSAVHWIEAPPPLGPHLGALVEAVARMLAEADAAGPRPPVASLAYRSAPADSHGTEPAGGGARRRRAWKRWVVAAAAVALAAGVILAFFRPAGRRVAATNPATAPATNPSAALPPGTIPVDQNAVNEVLDDVERLDRHLDVLLLAAEIDPGDPAFQATYEGVVRDLRRGESFANAGNTVYPSPEPAGHRGERREDVLARHGAAAGDWAALAACLRPLADPNGPLRTSERLQEILRRRRFHALALALKGFDPADERDARADEQERAFARKYAGAGIAQRRASYARAHVAALRLLAPLRLRPRDEEARLAALKRLEPRRPLSGAEAAAEDARWDAERKRLAAGAPALEEEAARVWKDAMDHLSGRLQPPYKFAARPPAEVAQITALVPGGPDERWRIEPGDSPAAATAKLLELRAVDMPEALPAAVASFCLYAAHFSGADPGAEEYARAGAQFSLQMSRFNVQGGMYLYRLQAGPAGEAGLLEGDILTTYAGKPVASQDDLSDALKGMPDAEPARVEYLRKDAKGVYTRRFATLSRGGALGAAFVPI